MKYLMSILLLGAMSSTAFGFLVGEPDFDEALSNCNEQAVEQVQAEFSQKFAAETDVWVDKGYLVNFNEYRAYVIVYDKTTDAEYLVSVKGTATPGAAAPLRKACIKLNAEISGKSLSAGMGTSKLKRVFAQE